jgi:hypothetical protein
MLLPLLHAVSASASVPSQSAAAATAASFLYAMFSLVAAVQPCTSLSGYQPLRTAPGSFGFCASAWVYALAGSMT